MHTQPSPVVGAITTLVERWVRQDAARANAGRAASRLHRQRRELDDVTRYLATHQREWLPDQAGSTALQPDQGRRGFSGPP